MNSRPWLRLALFFCTALLFLVAANFLLVQTDSVTAITFHEMRSAPVIDLAVIGSSVVRDHFNEQLISEQTGMNAYSISVPSASFQTMIASADELFKVHHPSLVALVLEPYNFDTARENPEALYKVMPWLSGFQTRLRLYTDSARIDGHWINRALIFREFGAQSPADMLKALRFHIDPEGAFSEVAASLDENMQYMGRGYLRHSGTEGIEDKIRSVMLAEKDDGYSCPLLPETKSMFLSLRDKIEAEGARLIVVLSGSHSSHPLAEPHFLRYMQHVMDFCRENSMPCYNLLYAKEDFLPNLDAYYYDLFHMTGEGADIQSEAFARLINALNSGEDVSGWFYEKDWEYRETITRVVNCWIHKEKSGSFRAGCNTGSMVHPLYRFVLRDPDGRETLLRDYAKEKRIDAELPEGWNLRVYTRLEETPEQEPAYFDYPADYGYASLNPSLYKL